MYQDFMKSKEECSELGKKYKRNTYAVDQLREEIKNKDQELIELDKEFKKVENIQECFKTFSKETKAFMNVNFSILDSIISPKYVEIFAMLKISKNQFLIE